MQWVNSTVRALGSLGFLLLLSGPLSAQDTPVGPVGAEVATQDTPAAATNSEALRNAAQNPIASLVSVPIQDNFNFNIGPADRTQNVLNIQPVIPIKVSKDWNLIVRWIVPIIYQPIGVPQQSGPQLQNTGVYGLGDMNPSFFLSPSKPHKITWGVGPTLVFPTATNTTYLGQGKFSMGPSVVALVQRPHWTMGFLPTTSGPSPVNPIIIPAVAVNKPPVNQFLSGSFVNYNMKKGWYLTTAPIITANWRAPSGDVWTVPWGGGVGRIMKLGFQPVNITAQIYANPTRPANTSPWGLRLQFVLLFPKLSKEQEKGLLEQKLKQMNQEATSKAVNTINCFPQLRPRSENHQSYSTRIGNANSTDASRTQVVVGFRRTRAFSAIKVTDGN